MRWVVYLDMDAFYVSCELKRHPELRGQVVAVSADPRGGQGRGVVLSASYEARKFGLRSALPVSQAFRLCPSYVALKPDFRFYSHCSHEVMDYLRSRAPELRTFSIDEAAYPRASVDVGPVEAEAREVQAEVRSRFDLPCSLGVAPTLTLAKIATDQAKPQGVLSVTPENLGARLDHLPVRVYPGIGQVTERELLALGIQTLGQLAHASLDVLHPALGGAASHIQRMVRGEVLEQEWPEEGQSRSMGAMHTFLEDTRDSQELERVRRELVEELTEGLQRSKLAYRTVTVRVRFSDFHQVQRARSLPLWTLNALPLDRLSRTLLRELLETPSAPAQVRVDAQGPLVRPGTREGQRVRMLSVTAYGLREVPHGQRTMDDYGD